MNLLFVANSDADSNTDDGEDDNSDEEADPSFPTRRPRKLHCLFCLCQTIKLEVNTGKVDDGGG